MYFIFHRLDKKELLKKRQSCSTKNHSEVFITDNYCDQNEILLSKNQSLKEDLHLREANDKVSMFR